MSIDSETLSKIEEAMEFRRSKDPLNVEMNRLFLDMYPTEKFYSILKLGQASMLSFLKNELYKYLCKDDKEYIDAIIKSQKDDSEMKSFLDKLIK